MTQVYQMSGMKANMSQMPGHSTTRAVISYEQCNIWYKNLTNISKYTWDFEPSIVIQKDHTSAYYKSSNLKKIIYFGPPSLFQ
jgi:hypothetical protein